MSDSQNSRVPVVDGLRGTAILLVVLFHVFARTNFAFGINLAGVHVDAHTFVQAGFLGVELFFFVSGFCLMLPYAAALSGRRAFPTWNEYWSRRFWKIVPSYYLALIAIALFYPFERQASTPWTQDLLLHLAFLHAFNSTAFVSINSNFWSLAVEVEFYALFPVVVWGFIRSPVMTAAVLGAAGMAYSYFIASIGLDGTFLWSYQLPSFLPLFALGALSSWIYERFIRDREISVVQRREFAAIAVFSVVTLGCLFEQINRTGGGPVAWAWQNAHRFELGVVLSMFILSTAAAPRAVQLVVANPVLTFFSEISYNMYLWNAAIISLIALRWHGDPGWRGGVFALLAVTATSGVGLVLTACFERPLMRSRLAVFARIASRVRSQFGSNACFGEERR